MKVWSKVKFKDSSAQINLIAKALTKYLYHDNFVYSKVSPEVKDYLEKDLVNKVAGVLMLYYSRDFHRINDIVNKYGQTSNLEVVPEIEGYIQK